MSKRHNLKQVSTEELKVDRNVNFRDDYDLNSMAEEIRSAGRVLEPIHVEKETGIVLKGNRRVATCQMLLKDPALPSDLRANIVKLDVIYYENLTEKERTELVLDHGSQKPLSRVEVVKAIWRLVAMMYSFRDIVTLTYHLVARFTGNVRKAHEAQNLPPGNGREQFLAKWLKGTVDDYIMAAASMGEFVREQVILTETKLDRPLTAEEEKLFVMKTNRDRINALRKAKTKDKESGGWSTDQGGKEFNAAIEKFKEEDRKAAAGEDDGTPTRYTPTQMEATADTLQSRLAQYAYKHCAGKLSDAEKAQIRDMDTEVSRIERVRELIRQNLDRIDKSKTFSGGELHEVLRLVLDGTSQQFEQYVVRFNV